MKTNRQGAYISSTWRVLVKETIQALEQSGIAEARRNAEWMLCDVLQCSRTQLFAYPERSATPIQVQQLQSMVARRLKHEPVQYIVGYTEFWGLRLKVSPAVLIPRPETEQVVALTLDLLERLSSPRVLDIGTGSGCIPLALKQARPDADIFACDVSEDALGIAQYNAEQLGLDAHFVQADVLANDFPDRFQGPFSLVISNPPYVTPDEATELEPEVREYEPHLALFTNEDPLQFYRAIANHAQRLLQPHGILVFETHADYTHDVYRMLKDVGYSYVKQQTDLADKPRIVYAQKELVDNR